MSADFHKYGQSSKGSSVALFRNKELRSYCYYTYPKWNGGVYVSQSFNGSRTPAYSVSAYGVLLNLGKQQLTKQARDIQQAIVKIKEFVRKELPELEVIGDPKVKL